MHYQFGICSLRRDLLTWALDVILPVPQDAVHQAIAQVAAALIQQTKPPPAEPQKIGIRVEAEGLHDPESGVHQYWLKVEPIDPAGQVLLEDPPGQAYMEQLCSPNPVPPMPPPPPALP